ncbi:MAG: Single-stranded nucleic acid binding R3H domain protein [Candidatus Beckwithbacteria bacterium GW2011_GWB1_47_15]|uniref:Single-stranded nucleic acid binding R3H domain protein n=1 Tax=Candidatus Beckwithbacteria bacterium GW2011_GWB1_47_15 TaxID=1618371 RepID=A0A0G1UVP8_9BACT|nr:MAG: single-stranded nucleic acid binding R3H domain-containing protein, spoIIIJ-associated protein [Candidatus Beckwithbacteria bacterium GW2011_GWC1_49_16]AQS30643.1 hypothetical protein [uncultured bacterium]KKU35831.1 MAG: Single-stranded nucleic acid binding R3H domain protein [Candidatus Beckwithbacteria bacterium GW2011_GWA1_46_30]KKU61795.1 MAG: Single-stranded nucleic acid binding R3H domain protein [Candidatus Beckwithbacteria bacterium GW2011_GWB1_47_15]KKU72651.1 MAG: Single-stra
MDKKIKSLLGDLLDHLDIKPEKISVKKNPDDGYQVDIVASDEDAGVLIGYHGETISALQLILGLLLYKDQGQWVKVVVNVGDYRQKRSQDLEQMAQATAEKVIYSGEPIALFNLNPYERRLIHQFLSATPEVTTESQGEGKNRHLIVRLADEQS